MADLAQIGFRADTSELEKARASLEALPAAASKAESASAKLEKSFDTLGKATGDMVKSTDAVAKASEKLNTANKASGSAAGTAASATTKLNTAMDQSAAAAAKAAAASEKLQKQTEKTGAAASEAASKTAKSLNDQAKAFLATQKPYESGLVAPTGRKTMGGIVPNFEQNSAQINAGLDKIIGKQKETTAANDNFEKGLRKTNSTASASTGVMSGLSAAVSRLGVGFVAAFGVNKIIDFLTKANDATIALGETAKRTGIDLTRLQQLQAAGVGEGLSRAQFNTGAEALAQKLNEARYIETDLGKLFADNNIKLKDRNGQIISTNDALMRASGLIQNAATEFDKIKIAEALGLTRDWIPLLEQGPDVLNRMADEAGSAGNAIDAGMVQRAEDFRRDWATAVDRWVTMFQAAAGPILEIIDRIVQAVGRSIADIGTMLDGVRQAGVITRNAFHVMKGTAAKDLPSDIARYQYDQTKAGGGNISPELQARVDAEGGGSDGPLIVDVRVSKKGGKTTNVNSLFDKSKGGGGSGGSGKTDEESFESIVTKAEVRIQKLQAEKDAIGLTAEAAARLKYETDLLGQAKRADIELTDAQREKLMGLAAQMASTETQTKTLKSALDFGKDLTKGFLQDFLQGIRDGEGVFKSFGNAAMGVLNKISDKLISMAVDSLFSSGGKGGFGGILGSIGKLFFGGGSALGDAFTGAGKVEAFAKGGSFTNGLYTKPTLFQYANGGAFGVMGEAGPEAVMPLQRGPDGSLGVQMYGDTEGGGSSVNNDVNVTNVYQISGAVSSKEITAEIKRTAEETVNFVRRETANWNSQLAQDGAIV